MYFLAVLRKIVSILRDPYRPELHYMRGPGPKWFEVHSGSRCDGRHRHRGQGWSLSSARSQLSTQLSRAGRPRGLLFRTPPVPGSNSVILTRRQSTAVYREAVARVTGYLHESIVAPVGLLAVRRRSACKSMSRLRVMISMRRYKPDDRVTTFCASNRSSPGSRSRAIPAIAARSL